MGRTGRELRRMARRGRCRGRTEGGIRKRLHRAHGGVCFCIYVPIEGLGFLSVGVMDGPLGGSNQGWSVELIYTEGEYGGPVCNVPNRSIPKLVEAVRAFVRDGTHTGLTRHDLLCLCRDQHHATTRHLTNPVHMGDPECVECQEIHRGFQKGQMGRSVCSCANADVPAGSFKQEISHIDLRQATKRPVCVTAPDQPRGEWEERQ